jgi:quinoprotein relay system zinc metallohydrolase 2
MKKWHLGLEYLPMRALLRLSASACICLAGFASNGGSSDITEGKALPVVEIAPGVFVHQGVHAEVTADNLGAIANIGFIVGENCVAVIDSGGSFAEGSALRAAVRTRTAIPVCYVINTHGHPDHVYGNAAFVPDHPRFIGHQNLAGFLGARHLYYYKYLISTFGYDQAVKSAVVLPDVGVASDRTIDLGRRKLVLRAWAPSHTNNDLTVLDQNTGTLWLGDLLFTERIPVLDGKLSGWLATMGNLSAIAARRVVPGHGAVSSNWPAAMAPQARYLKTLQIEIRAAVRAGQSIQQAVAESGASERTQWQLFDAYHSRNATAAFAEIEWEN